jgi:hypothetical protein
MLVSPTSSAGPERAVLGHHCSPRGTPRELKSSAQPWGVGATQRSPLSVQKSSHQGSSRERVAPYASLSRGPDGRRQMGAVDRRAQHLPQGDGRRRTWMPRLTSAGTRTHRSCQREKGCGNWLLVREGGFCQFPEMGCTGVPECRALASGESSLDSANAVGDDDWIPA